MRNTRTRAATAAILAAIGCMAMDDPGGNRAGNDLPTDDPAPSGSVDRGDLEDAAADRAVSRMRERVREEERALRASLDASEAGRDWAELLERKHSTDGWLMPMHLVRDAMRGVLPDAACEPLAAWRVEWRHAPVREAWSHAQGPERARRSLDAWVPRPGSGEALRIAATTTGERWVGCDAPATCAWSVEGSWGVEGPVVHGRCWWRFPLAERVRVDLPLAGDGMDLWWDDRGARCQDDRGGFHQETWPHQPIFCNPPTIYAAFDSLRAAAAPDARCTVAIATGPGVATDGTGHDASARAAPTERGATRTACTRTVRREDGSIVRTDRWEWEGEALRMIRIAVEPLRLLHHGERSFRLTTEIQGVMAEGSEHRPSSEIEEFPHGCEVLVHFRMPIDGIDAPRLGVGTATVPDAIEFRVAGEPVAHVRFAHVRLGVSSAIDAFEVAALDARRAEGAAHHAHADALERAIAGRDDAAVEAAVAAIADRHASAGTVAMALADELELIGGRLAAAGMQAAETHVRARRAAIAGDGVGRPRARGVPCVAPDVVAQGEHAAEPAASSTPGAPAGDPCLRAGNGARRLAQCAAEAITAAGMAGPWVDCIRNAICADRAHIDAPACDDAAAHRITRDLADALRAGAVALPEGDDSAEECAGFAAAMSDAAMRRAVEPGELARARAAFDAACDGARRSMRAALAQATLDSRDAMPFDDAFERLAAVRRAMLGNSFAGAPLPSAGRHPDPAGCLAAAEGDGSIGRAVEHELARSQALSKAAGPSIGAARLRTAHRRVASAAMEAVERAMQVAVE